MLHGNGIWMDNLAIKPIKTMSEPLALVSNISYMSVAGAGQVNTHMGSKMAQDMITNYCTLEIAWQTVMIVFFARTVY